MSNLLDTPRVHSLQELVDLLQADDAWEDDGNGIGRRQFVLERPEGRAAHGTAVQAPPGGVLQAQRLSTTRVQILARGACQMNGYDQPVGSVTIIPPDQAPALLTFGPDGGILLEISCEPEGSSHFQNQQMAQAT